MAYRSTRKSAYSETIVVDMLALARDLAKEMGGRDVACRDPEHSSQFRVGDDTITLWRSVSDKKVKANIQPADLSGDELRNLSFNHSAHTAQFDPDGRSIPAIVKDLQRRMIVPAQADLARARERASQYRDAEVRTLQQVEAAKAIGIEFSPHGRQDRYSMPIWKAEGVSSLTGTVTAQGIELRLPTVSMDKAARILAILREA